MSYIEFKLKARESSIRLRKKIINKVSKLRFSPNMYQKIAKRDRIYIKIVIDNYILLYVVDKKEKIVFISHMYYGRRNYIDNLLF